MYLVILVPWVKILVRQMMRIYADRICDIEGLVAVCHLFYIYFYTTLQ